MQYNCFQIDLFSHQQRPAVADLLPTDDCDDEKQRTSSVFAPAFVKDSSPLLDSGLAAMAPKCLLLLLAILVLIPGSLLQNPLKFGN